MWVHVLYLSTCITSCQVELVSNTSVSHNRGAKRKKNKCGETVKLQDCKKKKIVFLLFFIL